MRDPSSIRRLFKLKRGTTGRRARKLSGRSTSLNTFLLARSSLRLTPPSADTMIICLLMRRPADIKASSVEDESSLPRVYVRLVVYGHIHIYEEDRSISGTLIEHSSGRSPSSASLNIVAAIITPDSSTTSMFGIRGSQILQVPTTLPNYFH
ncbi:hypothetical protein WOLCODRAFT_150915 [Wolfiporia cocos MD-104 SS10]|uniref:Uncharacterized protein n=1 Tax=Wolfiporia cocos (strain MD-104) TaxID=742152 RepID=A0A2H3JF97_WOLCO|nr:hypothetical protein WOLCODRAFT_150915 [Wolfiporia cocos MD-104 SS10]